MFIDEIKMQLIAGKGGDGCTSFRREKYVPMGGPDGGSGGKGGDIIFEVDPGLSTLVDLKFHKIIKSQKGENGTGKNCRGKNAPEMIIKVPLGTTIYDDDTGLVIADLVMEDDRVIVAHGGRGGRGNASFATQEKPAPSFSELGEPGEIRYIRCELKLLADVGLVGMPSVGKSSILKAVTSSEPKIAAYHFTTLSPNLGVVKLKSGKQFVLADLPGMIEGASAGVGLGIKFLRHASRTRMLVHVLDMAGTEGRDPVSDYETIRKEICSYQNGLEQKKEVIVANKADLPSFQENLKRFQTIYPDFDIFPVSAVTKVGLDSLMNYLADTLETIPKTNLFQPEDYESTMVYRFQNKKPYTIVKDGDVWVLKGEEIEKLLAMTRFTEEEGVERFSRKLKGMGVDDELRRLGAQSGDEVEIAGYRFSFQ